MNQVQMLLSKLYRGIGSARSKRLDTLVRRGEWNLLQQEVLSHPTVYRHSEVYFKDALAVEVARKLLLPGSSEPRRAAAVATFWASEHQCAATNARLSKFVNLQGPFVASDEQLITFISRWRTIVRRVLGKPPVLLTPRFSAGSTLSDHGKRVTIPDKLSSEPTFYAGSDLNLRPHLNGTPFFHAPVRWTRGNRFFTVPKDSSKDRGCCVEASLAVSLQLDAGNHIVRRIEKAYQVDMKRLPDYHRWLAELASRHGTFATIDLSNASDTVASGLVELLLPPDWFTLLNSLRAKRTEIEGRTVYLQKFSSMGNGFTFPLETLIFRTLAEAVGSRCASVFGDDIVIESERGADLVAALGYFGFTPNSKKSFLWGPFRESCGGDYFQGRAVRPYYLKKPPVEPQQWIAVANGLRRADPELKYARAAWRYAVDQIPIHCRVFASDPHLCGDDDDQNSSSSCWGDLAIFDPSAKPVKRRVPASGHVEAHWAWCWRVVITTHHHFSLFEHFPFDVAFIAASMGVPDRVTPRDSIKGYRLGWVESAYADERDPGQ